MDGWMSELFRLLIAIGTRFALVSHVDKLGSEIGEASLAHSTNNKQQQQHELIAR